jgi:hypothetical protein
MLGGVVVGNGGTVSRPDRDESDDGAINLGNQNGAVELATPTEHEVQISVGDAFTGENSGVKRALEILELNEATSDGLTIAQRIELSDLQHTPAAQRIGVQRRGIAPPDSAEPQKVDARTVLLQFEPRYSRSGSTPCGAAISRMFILPELPPGLLD